MEQALLEGVAPEQEEVWEWEEEVAEAGWKEPDLVQDPEEIVCVPLVELVLLIRLDCRAIKLSVLNAAPQW